MRHIIGVSAAAMLMAIGVAHATQTPKVGDIFVIAMENQNSATSCTPAPACSKGLLPLYGNSAAPYINSLITPGNANAAMVSYSGNYTNIIVSPAAGDLHPSEPNYVYQISGLTGEKGTDNPPGVAPSIFYPAGTANLGSSLTANGLTWKSYQEGIELYGNVAGSPTNPTPGVIQSVSTNYSGTSSAYTNPYNNSHQYNFAAKHDPFSFFADTNNAGVAGNSVPLTQLGADLTGNTVANFNWITPDQYNDMHSTLTGGFMYNGTQFSGNQASIAQGDNFLSQIIPQIEASQAFKNNGMIVIWTDENEGDTPGTNGQYTNMEIIISPLAKGNAYTNDVAMNHDTDLATYLELAGVSRSSYPTAIQNSNNLGSLLVPGSVPEPATWSMMMVGVGFMGAALRGARKVRPARA